MPTKAELEAENARLRKDMALIGRTLKAQADHRGWCSEYESVIQRLDQKLLVPLGKASRYISERNYDIGMHISVSLPPRSYFIEHTHAPHRVAQLLGQSMHTIRECVASALGCQIDQVAIVFEAIDMVPDE